MSSFLRPCVDPSARAAPRHSISMARSRRAATTRIAPRWVRSAPKSRSTSRASGSSRRSATSPPGPPFTDHFLSDFHLTRIESSGVGAGARFRVEAPLRSVWMDTTIVELDEPHRIVERGQGGRVNRIPTHTVWELTEGPGSLTSVRVSHWTEPGPARPRRWRSLSAGSVWQERGWREALRQAPRRPRVRRSGGRADRRRRGQQIRDRHPLIDSRRRWSPNRRLVLPLLAALALASSSSASPPAATRATPRTSSRARPVKLGELQFNVTFSRYLNPNDNEDSAYLVGQPPPPEGSTYFGVFFEVQNESEEAADAALDADDHRRGRQDLRRDPERKPLRAPVRRRSRTAGTDPGSRLDPAAGPDRGLAGALPAAGRSLRQPPADAAHPGRRRRRRPKSRSTSSGAAPAG